MDTVSKRVIGLYQVRDTVAQSVSGPIIAAHHGAAATRIFTDALRDSRTQLAQHPGDFELLLLGMQDEETGEISAVIPTAVITGAQWLLMQSSTGDGDRADSPRVSTAPHTER